MHVSTLAWVKSPGPPRPLRRDEDARNMVVENAVGNSQDAAVRPL
jgi:hypothetical protein